MPTPHPVTRVEPLEEKAKSGALAVMDIDALPIPTPAESVHVTQRAGFCAPELLARLTTGTTPVPDAEAIVSEAVTWGGPEYRLKT